MNEPRQRKRCKKAVNGHRLAINAEDRELVIVSYSPELAMNDSFDLVTIGKIEKPFGLCGEVRVRSLSDVPGRFETLSRAILRSPSGRVLATAVKRVRAGGGSYIVGFEALTTPEEAAAFRGGLIQIPRSESPALPEGRYYEYDLVGMQVKTELGEPLGTLEEVWELPANHVLVVRRQGREILIPATKDVVVSVDVADRIMTIRPIEGLAEYQDAV